MKHWLLAAALAGGAAGAWACGEALGAGTQKLAADGWQIAWRAAPSPVPVGKHFALDIALCAPAGQALPAALRVDATMPEHKHGMNYRPSVKAPTHCSHFSQDRTMVNMVEGFPVVDKYCSY